MAVPRNRTSNARKNARRSHHAKQRVNAVACPNCAAHKQSHTLCTSCGWYNGRSVIAVEAKKAK